MGEVASSSQGPMWGFGVLVPCSRVHWQCPAGVLAPPPATRTPPKICPHQGLEPRTICLSAQYPTDELLWSPHIIIIIIIQQIDSSCVITQMCEFNLLCEQVILTYRMLTLHISLPQDRNESIKCTLSILYQVLIMMISLLVNTELQDNTTLSLNEGPQVKSPGLKIPEDRKQR